MIEELRNKNFVTDKQARGIVYPMLENQVGKIKNDMSLEKEEEKKIAWSQFYTEDEK